MPGGQGGGGDRQGGGQGGGGDRHGGGGGGGGDRHGGGGGGDRHGGGGGDRHGGGGGDRHGGGGNRHGGGGRHGDIHGRHEHGHGHGGPGGGGPERSRWEHRVGPHHDPWYPWCGRYCCCFFTIGLSECLMFGPYYSNSNHSTAYEEVPGSSPVYNTFSNSVPAAQARAI